MPPPSDLVIATKSVQRLIKEESYYRVELAKQEQRVQQLEAEIKASGADLDANAEYVLKQESKAIEDTKAVFAPLKRQTADAVAKLEEHIDLSKSNGGVAADELTKAEEVLILWRQAVEKESS